jgi:hypothetical protein
VGTTRGVAGGILATAPNSFRVPSAGLGSLAATFTTSFTADTTPNTTTDSLLHHHHPYNQSLHRDGTDALFGAASGRRPGLKAAAAGAADVKIALTHLETVLDEGASITHRLRNLRV